MDRGGIYGPYLSERNTGCYNHAPLAPVQSGAEQHNPCCQNGGTIDCCGNNNRETYLDMFKERWRTLRITEPCQLKTEHFNPCQDSTSRLAAKGQIALKNVNEICGSPPYDKGVSVYKKDYKYPKSHNAIDDCCPAPCPCVEKFPELPSNINYACTSPQPCQPLDSCTTYRHFFVPHDAQPRYVHYPKPYDPCECPLEECTITKSDYTKKEPIPNAPACAQIIRHGLWSTDQMCKGFSDSTTTGDEYVKKRVEKRCPFRAEPSLCIPNYPFTQESVTRADFPPKSGEDVCYPEWISNDGYYKPETELESCTTYKHFYRPYPIPVPLQTTKVGLPDAIPFCTLNKLCYTCHDPKPNQKTPVEIRNQDPWPYVKPFPIRYQDNLQVDPCADFCDITMYKSEFYPKALCRRVESCKPVLGYTDPTLPFNDNTTQKISFPAYNKCEYEYALGNAGNPCGTYWGPYYCRENVDKCTPRFPAPFGHPLKPFLNPKCPCGPFDDRSTYNHDFRFRSSDVVAEIERDMCQEPNVPKGISLSRFDYVEQAGKKAEIEKPPISKGYRCMHPCSLQSTDTLYRIDYYDFWKSMERPNLELYRGKPTIRTRRPPEQDVQIEDAEDGGEILVLQPVCYKKKGKCRTIEEARAGNQRPENCSSQTVDFQSQAYQRCREIPYSGQDILHRAPFGEVANGYQ